MKKLHKKTSSFQPQTIVLALSTLFFAGVVYAQTATPETQQENNAAPPCAQNSYHGHGYKYHHKGWNKAAHGWLTENLQLTDAQQTQLKDISQKLWDNRKALVEQMADVQSKLNEALYQPQLDKPAITSLQEQKNKLRLELSKMSDQARLQAIETLTPEQRKALGEQAAQWKNKRRGPARDFTPPCAQEQQKQQDKVAPEPEQTTPASPRVDAQGSYEYLLLPGRPMAPKR